MKPEEVMKSIEAVAPEKGLPIIGPTRGVFLDDVVREHDPKTILEVGTLVGYSAIRMGRLLKKGSRITCLEVREDMSRIALSNIEEAGLSDTIEVMTGDAKALLPKLRGTFDMVFLDAAKDEYIAYLKSCERLLHPGSVVVADNVKSHAEEVSDYLDYVRNSGKYRSTYREATVNYRYGAGRLESDAVEISIKL